MHPLPRLTALHPLTRLGIAMLVLVLLGGYFVSGIHLRNHYSNRDMLPELTLDDIRGHYHGITTPSMLGKSLGDRHPEDLPARERNLLLEWLKDPASLSTKYDDFDLGDDAPAEIIAAHCLDCHARNATGEGTYAKLPLEYFDDIRPLAVSREINPTTPEIVAMSQHTHAPVMAVILIVLALLGAMTRAPRALCGLILSVGAVGLLADMSGWWLARSNDVWVYAIVGGGFAYAAATGLIGLIVILDCMIPCRKERPAA